MPRKSFRQKAIELMRHHLRKLNIGYISRQVSNEHDAFEDFKLHRRKRQLQLMCNKQYMFRSPYYRKDRNIFDIDDTLSYDSKNFNNEEFLNAFRITRESFFC